MERLTRRIVTGKADCAYCTGEYMTKRGCSNKCELRIKQKERLTAYEDLGRTPSELAADLAELAELKRQKGDGTLSDGYHTFNELYHHRGVLFSVICNANPLMAWKSKKHHDGTMYDGMFIVGIETPDGQATYHYDMIPYWDMFNVKELFYAPEWDGHTPQDAIWRIGNLRKKGGNQ